MKSNDCKVPKKSAFENWYEKWGQNDTNIYGIIFIACLADEELQAEEESIEELRRRAEEERFRAQLEAQQREEERRLEEERRYLIIVTKSTYIFWKQITYRAIFS